MSRGEGLFFEHGPRRFVTGEWVTGETRGCGSPVRRTGVLAYRNGVFFIEPVLAGGCSFQIGTSPGQVHPGTVARG